MEGKGLDLELATAGDTESSLPSSSSTHSLQFENVRFAVKTSATEAKLSKEKNKEILHGVSGTITSGELLALMGPSGSGKTTLLTALFLAQQGKRETKEGVLTHGELYIDGKIPTKGTRIKSGFVFQDDLLLSNLTVYETIRFSALLRLPENMSEEEKESRVANTIDSLRLNKCANSSIGNHIKRGVSGGERKRTAVACELVTKPSLLFLDEPTSGLDAHSALNLIRVLNELARKDGLMLVCSIHQPRSNIFSLFTKLLLLDNGHTVYCGKTLGVVDHFESLGLMLPPLTNAADWLIDVLTEKETDVDLAKAWQEKSPPSPQQSHSTPAGTPPTLLLSGDSDRDEPQSRWPTSRLFQFRVLVERCAKQQRGDVFNNVNMFQILTVAIIASVVWWQSDSAEDITGVLFFVNIQQSFNTMNGVLRLFPPERALLQRERSVGAYQMLPYFLAKSSTDTMATFLLPIIYATIVYWCVGLRGTAEAFFSFLALFILSIGTAQSLGLVLAAAVPDLALVNSLNFIIVLFIMLFAGFYVDVRNLPAVVSWIPNISFMYWSFGGMLANQFSGKEFSCSFKGSFDFSDDCPFDGDEVVKAMGFNGATVTRSLIVLACMALFFRVCAYLVLRFKLQLI